MQTRSETGIATNGAKVEVGTIVFNGKEFSALGSVIDTNRGFVIGYPSDDNRILKTWDGQEITKLHVTGKAHGFNGTKLTCYSCVIDGFHYHGRGLGAGMILRLHKGRKGKR